MREETSSVIDLTFAANSERAGKGWKVMEMEILSCHNVIEIKININEQVGSKQQVPGRTPTVRPCFSEEDQ